MPKIRRFLIGLLFAALFMIVWTALEIYLPASSLKGYLQTAAGIVFTIAGLYFMFRRTRDSQSRAVEAKIESLKKAGQPLAVETEEPFNGNDRNVFSRRQNSLILSAVILVIIATAMGGFVVYVFADPANHFLYQVITFCLAVSITIPLTLHDYRKLEKQKQTGTKTIVQGIVTRKYSDDDDSSPSYYIEIDKLSIMVEQNLYSKYEVGDGIEIHIYKPRFNMVLFDRKIESTW